MEATIAIAVCMFVEDFQIASEGKGKIDLCALARQAVRWKG